jgi:hypothetical protein
MKATGWCSSRETTAPTEGATSAAPWLRLSTARQAPPGLSRSPIRPKPRSPVSFPEVNTRCASPRTEPGGAKPPRHSANAATSVACSVASAACAWAAASSGARRRAHAVQQQRSEVPSTSPLASSVADVCQPGRDRSRRLSGRECIRQSRGTRVEPPKRFSVALPRSRTPKSSKAKAPSTRCPLGG